MAARASAVSKQLDGLVQRLRAPQDDPIRTLAVASSVRGEGTTTCVINVATHLATYHDRRVLVVDANLRDPSLHIALRLPIGGGTSDLLGGRIGLDAALKETRLPNLFAVTAGTPASSPSQLLGGSSLGASLFDAATGYDYVLLDCPPVNDYPDTASLAPQCDGVILVVHAGKTRSKAAQSAKAKLEAARANVLGVMLNKRKYHIPDFIYRRL